jgi:hypothetical protein
VLLRDELDTGAERLQVVDVGGVRADRHGERPLLRAPVLVGLVEESQACGSPSNISS